MALLTRGATQRWNIEGNDSAAFSPLYLQDQISAGLGGPIVKDKLFIFGSAQFRRLSNPFQSLLAASPGSLSSLGIQADSASQFINTVNGYGVPLNSASVPARRIGDNTVGLLRLDYFVSDGSTLTLRADYRHQSQDPTRSSPLALPTISGTSATTGSGIAAILTSAFQNGIINQFSSYLSKSANHADPFLALPAGRVRVTSLLPGATQGISVLGFGGNPSLPQQGDDGLLELSDELSYLTHDRTHRIKLGGLLDVSRFNQDLTGNRIGTFTFNSLQDFVRQYSSQLYPHARLSAVAWEQHERRHLLGRYVAAAPGCTGGVWSAGGGDACGRLSTIQSGYPAAVRSQD